jgi:hypothetical protein
MYMGFFQGCVRSLSVGGNSIWGVKSDGTVSVRMGVTNETPVGQEWITVDGEPMKQVRFFFIASEQAIKTSQSNLVQCC